EHGHSFAGGALLDGGRGYPQIAHHLRVDPQQGIVCGRRSALGLPSRFVPPGRLLARVFAC
ncbi:MAG: hypothetical protein ABW298_03460, partial [Candidatus Binatia bacterium]